MVQPLVWGLAISLLALTAGFVFFGEQFFGVTPAALPISIATIERLLIVGVAGGALYYFRESKSETQSEQDTTFVDTASPPEVPQQAPRLVGQQHETSIEAALRAVQLKDVAYQQTEPHERLSELAHESLKVTYNCSDDKAAQLIESGEWTDDRVAAAFLTDTTPPDYPIWFQLLRWARPGQAYETALIRTSSAVNDILGGNDQTTTSPVEDSVAPLRNWVETIRATMYAQLNDSPTETQPTPQRRDQNQSVGHSVKAAEDPNTEDIN